MITVFFNIYLIWLLIRVYARVCTITNRKLWFKKIMRKFAWWWFAKEEFRDSILNGIKDQSIAHYEALIRLMHNPKSRDIFIHYSSRSFWFWLYGIYENEDHMNNDELQFQVEEILRRK